MDEYDELTAWAHQEELEAQQWQEWQKRDAVYLFWALMMDAADLTYRLTHEQEHEHGSRLTHSQH